MNPYCVESEGDGLWDDLHDMFAREKGLKQLGNYWREGKLNIE